MVAQSASGQFRSSDTVSLADGVSATNPFAGFSASAQAITIAGQNALLQSAVTLKDFSSTYVRFQPPSDKQRCVYGDTGTVQSDCVILAALNGS